MNIANAYCQDSEIKELISKADSTKMRENNDGVMTGAREGSIPPVHTDHKIPCDISQPTSPQRFVQQKQSS
jgi:hypothetical protein